MAATPRYKIYSGTGEYIAAIKHLEDAAAFVGIIGKGATVRQGHSPRDVIWAEGAEESSASESYDWAAEVMRSRLRQ